MSSPGNHLLATVSISNPTQDPIWILAWNNAFDNTTRLPVLFSVKDDLGDDVQLASTYVMRAGMSERDFFLLAPGQSYYRTIDLRQIMQNLPSGPSKPSGAGLAPKVFTIYPPRSFKGFFGNASVPAEAAADLTGDPPTLGDFKSADLQNIVVSSKPQRYNAVFPLIAAGNLDPSFMSDPDGIHVDTDCAAQNLTDSSDTIFDAGVYANSLGMAANDSSSPLFPLFFPAASRQVVSEAATAATNAISGIGPHVDLYCTDLENLCNDPNILGYSSTPSFIGNAYTVLCPSARALGRAPQPCYTPETGYQRSASTSHVFFHLLMTLNNVVTPTMDTSIYGTSACGQLSNSTLIDPTKNADSYAQLAIAHWSYGLGGPPYNGKSCLPSSISLPSMQKRASSVKHIRSSESIKDAPRAVSRIIPPRHVKRGLSLYELLKTQDCSAAEADLLNIALANARALAKYASDDIAGPANAASTNRWTTLFNGDDNIKKEVKAIFDAVANWNTSSPYASDVAWRCDPIRRSAFCRGPATAGVFYTYDSGRPVANLIACPAVFNAAISLECIDPMNTPSYVKEFSALEMGGTVMHELLHISTVINSQRQILDGSPPCYNWECMTQNAHDRVLPGFREQNLPENVAVNYQYFAFSARAARADCSWTDYTGSAYGSLVAAHKMVGSEIYGSIFGR